MNRPRLKIPGWQKRWLYAALGVLTVSGLAWLALHYLGASDEGLPSPIEPWLMRLHGSASFAALLGLGSVAGAHVPQGWRLTQRYRLTRQRNSGLVLSALFAGAVLSAYALYYFAPESLRNLLGWLHSALGLCGVAVWILHRPRAR